MCIRDRCARSCTRPLPRCADLCQCHFLLPPPRSYSPRAARAKMPKSAAAPDADQATTTTVAAAVSSRAPTQPAHRTRASLPELADVRSRRAMKQSQRRHRRAAATSRLSANYGCSVFLLRVRASYPSSPTLPHHRNSTSPCLLARSVHRSSTVSRLDASDPVGVHFSPYPSHQPCDSHSKCDGC